MGVELKKPKPGGAAPWGFCSRPHPELDDVWCRKLTGHQKHGDDFCSAFTFSIKTPTEWMFQ